MAENYLISLLGLGPATREIKFKFDFILFTSIKFHKRVKNYVISLLGLGPATRETTGKLTETIKNKNL